jgi:predicted 3-demethylubiquinone-9 3-methyltransferase (glyoxalase superfamily)
MLHCRHELHTKLFLSVYTFLLDKGKKLLAIVLTNIMQNITPFLWFNDNAEEAMHFYVSVFKNSRVTSVLPGPNGKASGVGFILDGQEFRAINGGPQFSFSEAISFMVDCDSQEEIDYFWEKLPADGGKTLQCGWLKDRYGISWQIIPRTLGTLLGDPATAPRVMQALMTMEKIDSAKLEEVAKG